MKKAENNVAQLTDDEILEGFRNADEHIVKEYFYGYCRVAYYIYDRRYDLQYKPGMDFYSLAHEYYLALIKHDFRQLEDRKPSMSLKTWMVNGFRFLVLDKLKGLKKEQLKESLEERMGNTHLRFDVHDDEFAGEFRSTIDEICRTYYGRDSRNSIILQMLFVEGFKGKEIAAQLGISQPAVTERYNRMMHDVVVPYFKRYFVTNKYGLPTRYEKFMEDECSYSMARPSVGAKMPRPSVGANRDFIFRDMDKKKKGRVTPSWIDDLQENQVFVFGSNLAGMHGGGAARVARLRFGAVMGNGVGMQGRSYAIPTMQGGTETIRPYVNDFIAYAKEHPELTFLVTPIGCGIAGFEPEDIAPLFELASYVENIWLPKSFWEVLE
jgi:DNA-directed RNA polymerase specialized sigma24 family protein